ncbi:hypothetical protein AM1_5061 [Acaryochloris marina MBIC11017]|uniref:Uncharacterized protein n=1 Tax=Acaryochloris marina (strain MBIC 11017) TaxID=329726 RepID=B0C750_ACAM1|nr:hypothetical protein AM1_5061 [Acaryochloris marina MBIC11017]
MCGVFSCLENLILVYVQLQDNFFYCHHPGIYKEQLSVDHKPLV